MRREGFDVEAAEDATGMDEILARRRPDLVVLDLMLPGEDGLSVCRRLRTHTSLPILMLTAKSDEIDRVVGLEMGADDYLVKPFGPRELLARVRAVLRRGGPAPATSQERRFSFNGFTIDLDARELTDERHTPIATGPSGCVTPDRRVDRLDHDFVQVEASERTILLTVDDEGAGIPPDPREAMLEPFVRMESSRNRRTGGAGLGLAVVRNLVEVHGGVVKISDAPEGGARFTVSLPLFVLDPERSRVTTARPDK